MAPFARAVLLAVAAGAALGFAGQTGSDLHPGLRWVVALGVPWLLTAFFAGAIVGDRLRGALAGSACARMAACRRASRRSPTAGAASGSTAQAGTQLIGDLGRRCG